MMTIGLLSCCASGAHYPKSDHFNGERFFNPTTSGEEGGFFRAFRWLANRPPLDFRAKSAGRIPR
jgi:hypothetical protein